MAERILKNISSRGLKNAVRGNEYRKEASISYGILIGGYVLFQILTAAGLIGHNLQGQFVPICVYVSLAVSLNLVVGISGELSLGHAGFMAVGAFSGILMSRILGQSMSFEPAIIIISMLFGALIASFDGDGRLRFAFNHTIEGVENNDRIITGAIGATGTKTMATFTWGLLLCLFTVFIVLNLKNSKQGRAIMSIRDNRIAGESIGLDVRKYKLMAFVVSAALAGMAGCLFGLNYSTLVPVKFNFNTSVLILVFVVLGGVGNIWGGIIAAALLTVLPETFRQFADYRMLTYAIVLILVMIGTYNPAIKARITGIWSKINPVKKRSGGKGKGKKAKSRKGAA